MTAKSLSTEEFDRIFDEGEEDVLQYCDLDKAVVSDPAFETRRVNVDFPAWVVEALDREARRIGIGRQAVIKTWIAERLDEEASAAALERLRGLPSGRGKAPQGGGRKGLRPSPAACIAPGRAGELPPGSCYSPPRSLAMRSEYSSSVSPASSARSMTGASFHRASSR